MPHIHDRYDFTVSAFILHPDEPKILLLHHKKLSSWLQPGGHIELHEHPLEALYHELEEETGLTINDYEFLPIADQPAPNGSLTLPHPLMINVHPFSDTHEHIDTSFLLRAKTDKLTSSPDGADDIRWFDLKELEKLRASNSIFQGTYDICTWIFDHKL